MSSNMTSSEAIEGRGPLRLLLIASAEIADANRFIFEDCLPRELRMSNFNVVAPWAWHRPERPPGFGPARGNIWYDRWLDLSFAVAMGNQTLIDGCDAAVIVLDCSNVSGATIAPIGYAHGRGKPIFALAPDFDNHVDRETSPIDPSVEWLVHASGGLVTRTIEQLINSLDTWRSPAPQAGVENVVSLFKSPILVE